MSTIKEVAKEAGVSVGSVSRFLNGYNLKKENEIKIKRAISILNFKENIIAKGLKSNKSLSVGVVINNLTDVFATSIVSYLESYLENRNYSLLICDYQNDLTRLERKLEFLYSRSVDGLVIFHLEENLDILGRFRDSNIPVVAVDAPIKNFTSDTVLVDNFNSSYQAVEKLVTMGHKKIGIIAGDTNRYIGYERLAGYIEAMKNHGLYDENLIKIGDYQRKSGYYKTIELLSDNQITALYSVNYYMTLGVVQAIIDEGYKIPQDISVFGFDYFEIFDIFSPKLTVLEQPVKEIGEKIGEVLLEKIKNNGKGPNMKIELMTRTIWRDSVIENHNK